MKAYPGSFTLEALLSVEGVYGQGLRAMHAYSSLGLM